MLQESPLWFDQKKNRGFSEFPPLGILDRLNIARASTKYVVWNISSHNLITMPWFSYMQHTWKKLMADSFCTEKVFEMMLLRIIVPLFTLFLFCKNICLSFSFIMYHKNVFHSYVNFVYYSFYCNVLYINTWIDKVDFYIMQYPKSLPKLIIKLQA